MLYNKAGEFQVTIQEQQLKKEKHQQFNHKYWRKLQSTKPFCFKIGKKYVIILSAGVLFYIFCCLEGLMQLNTQCNQNKGT